MRSTRSGGWTIDFSPCIAVPKYKDVAPIARAGIFDVVSASIGVVRSKRSCELTLWLISGWLRVLLVAASSLLFDSLEGIIDRPSGE